MKICKVFVFFQIVLVCWLKDVAVGGTQALPNGDTFPEEKEPDVDEGFVGKLDLPRFELSEGFLKHRGDYLAQFRLVPPADTREGQEGDKGDDGEDIEGFEIYTGPLPDDHRTFQEYLDEGMREGKVIDPEATAKKISEDDGKTRRLRRQLNVFLPDNRIGATPATMDIYPYRTVGLFRTPGGGQCTATLVYRHIIVTNRHCLGLVGNSLPSNFWTSTRFLAGLSNGVSNYQVSFNYVAWSGSSGDTAYLRLVEPIGNYVGWMGIKWTAATYFWTQRTSAKTTTSFYQNFIKTIFTLFSI
uniref:Serine protease n=1 Tax=Aplanochytrium stocchinoi TaxID=215587 RepID=A0A7S3UZB0_9STRA|mmetsp:Transcript_16715/g.21362  ORF Transcript_16715/g.21362 Transcript_16715/m.21362 type:complete len:300 (+) Transcript_16715:773-1672(+)